MSIGVEEAASSSSRAFTLMADWTELILLFNTRSAAMLKSRQVVDLMVRIWVASGLCPDFRTSRRSCHSRLVGLLCFL